MAATSGPTPDERIKVEELQMLKGPLSGSNLLDIDVVVFAFLSKHTRAQIFLANEVTFS